MNVPANRPNTTLAGPDYNPFTTYGHASSQRNIVGTLLKFQKGKYRYGERSDVMAGGARMIANMEELLVGMIKWGDNHPVEHIMGRVTDGFVPPRRSELGDTDQSLWEVDDQGRPRDPWQMGNYLLLMPEKGGELYTFATGSRGGNNAIAELCKAYGKVYRMKPDQFPLIELAVGEYEHKVYSFIEFPVLKIVGWAARTAFDTALAAETSANEAQGNAGAEQQRAAANDNAKAANDNQKAAAAKAGAPKDDRRPQF